MQLIRIFGLLLSCGSALFLAEHFLTTAQTFVKVVNIRTIHEDINNALTVVTECFFIMFGLIMFCSNSSERKVHESVIKHAYNLTEIEASSLVNETNTGQFELNESAIEELALQYQAECPNRNVNDILMLKSLEISGIAQLLPSEARHLFEPLLKDKLTRLDETSR